MVVHLHVSDPHASLETLGHDVAERVARLHAGGGTLDPLWVVRLAEAVARHLTETFMAEHRGAQDERVLSFGGARDAADFTAWMAEAVLKDVARVVRDPAALRRLSADVPREIEAVFGPLLADPPPAAPPPAPPPPAQPAAPSPAEPGPSPLPGLYYGTRLPEEFYKNPPKNR